MFYSVNLWYKVTSVNINRHSCYSKKLMKIKHLYRIEMFISGLLSVDSWYIRTGNHSGSTIRVHYGDVQFLQKSSLNQVEKLGFVLQTKYIYYAGIK